MPPARTLSFLLLSLAALGGCATKSYDTLPSFDGAAAAADCGQVAVQTAEVERFRHAVQKESEFGGADVLAFLIDFGIGNAMAKDAALKRADLRMEQLQQRRTALRCQEAAPRDAKVTARSE